MVGRLQDSDGRPKWQARVVALLAVVGLVGVSLPALLSLLG